ncbi:hypothetical protein E5A73_04650 [Sphingomonas gei]|uniref:Terminase n=1 Tax=Sphingomonas gei TaxID=1395960 RepID=A0A4S1XGG5_9SPHN|nr:hypothetical protein E5A73_04650 [Sphingomonas gei]
MADISSLLGKERRKPRQSFTPDLRQRFLDALALTCNVHAAAAYAGVDRTTPYNWRRHDPEFLEQWRDAVWAGFDRLETMVLEAGGAGLPLEVAPGDADRVEADAPNAPPSFDFDKAMAVLRLYREKRHGSAPQRGRAPRQYPTREETNAALIKALTAAKKRLDKSDGD